MRTNRKVQVKRCERILDSEVDSSNYARFESCRHSPTAKKLIFRFPCGDTYTVTIADFLLWFRAPHYCRRRGRLVAWEEGKPYVPPADVQVIGVRKVCRGHAIRVQMGDGTVYDVAWDTVLMACEPRYEWFGGLPEQVKSASGQ